jgi:hypothetical protein
MSELLIASEFYKKEADRILLESDLAQDLSKFGEVIFTGAYAGNVMMHGDVDVAVVRDVPYTKDEVFTVMRTFYDKGFFRSYFIAGDWDDPRKGAEFPVGQYLGLKLKVGDERWKFDIWFVGRKEYEDSQKNFQIKNAVVDPEQKETILYFKKYRNDNNLPISGFHIYDAVLNKNCTTIEELISMYPIN